MIKNYTCRYLDKNQQVYLVKKHDSGAGYNLNHSVRNAIYLTKPFQNRQNNQIYNTLIGYTDFIICNNECKTYDDTVPFVITLQDVCQLSKTLHLPLVIIMNSYCDIETKSEQYEIYFYEK